MGMSGYELRFKIWQSANQYHQKRYDALKSSYDKGHIKEAPDIPSPEAILETAKRMRKFVEKGRK